jgi:hypothetical protein
MQRRAPTGRRWAEEAGVLIADGAARGIGGSSAHQWGGARRRR